jgi:hypothetical protein
MEEIRPAEVLSLKRDVDEVIYTNRLLFSDALFALIRARISFDLGDRRNLPGWSASMVDLMRRRESDTRL